VRSSSLSAACGGIASLAVNAGSGPGVVWLVFLFFFFSSSPRHPWGGGGEKK
jgi:hypothetical protein